ncbi:unnamed protein product [Fusarium graminearum]|nr:unnamed protein product [Fusarium graminearum]
MEFAAPWSTTVAVEATYMIQRLMSPCCIISTRAAHLAIVVPRIVHTAAVATDEGQYNIMDLLDKLIQSIQQVCSIANNCVYGLLLESS